MQKRNKENINIFYRMLYLSICFSFFVRFRLLLAETAIVGKSLSFTSFNDSVTGPCQNSPTADNKSSQYKPYSLYYLIRRKNLFCLTYGSFDFT